MFAPCLIWRQTYSYLHALTYCYLRGQWKPGEWWLAAAGDYQVLVVHSFNSIAQFPFFIMVQYLLRSNAEAAAPLAGRAGLFGALLKMFLGGFRW